MKKTVIILLVVLLVLISVCCVRAEDNILGYNTDELSNALPDEIRQSLSEAGVDGTDINALNNLSFDKILNEILKLSADKAALPLGTLAVLTAILLLNSMFCSLKSSAKTSAMQKVLSVCSVLCVTLTVSIPVIGVVDSSVTVIKSAADFMLAYIPAIVFIFLATGKAVSGSAYYSLTVFMAQCVSRASSDIIAPFLKLFLGLAISSAVAPEVNLSGVIKTISKFIKWILGFVLTVFSSFLTIKQIISSNIDSVSDRAIKFSLASFVPVAGTALSEAYKSVNSSVGLLKSGVGVFALIAVAFMFLPPLISCALWLFSLWTARSISDVLNLSEPSALLSSVSSVLSVVFAVLLSVASVFIISTALMLMIGGAG